jgi:DNA-binding transcriptional MerR regulator
MYTNDTEDLLCRKFGVTMLRIGEFSKIAQVSIKTLRYYDRLGLLKPAHIDRYNGYRYYNLYQLPRLNRILALKDLDFSLDQIQELLKLALKGTSLENMLRHKANELRSRILEERARLLCVESRLNQFDGIFENEAPPVLLKTAPDYLVATVRKHLPTLSSLAEWQHDTLQENHQYLGQQSYTFTGPDLLIDHHDEFREDDLDVEVGTIVRENRSNLESAPIMATSNYIHWPASITLHQHSIHNRAKPLVILMPS